MYFSKKKRQFCLLLLKDLQIEIEIEKKLKEEKED